MEEIHEQEYREEVTDNVEHTPPSRESVPPLTAASILITLGGVIVFLGLFLYVGSTPDTRRTTLKDSPQLLLTSTKDLFSELSLEAKAVFVWDILNQEVLYARNEEAQLPLASLTKLMTTLVVYETLPEETIITIDSLSLSTEGDSGLLLQERWLAKDLIDFTLITSSNDGASALASVAGSLESRNPEDRLQNTKTFIARMNKKAQELGLTQAYFLNETGLDTNDNISGGYGSARDLTVLLEYILRYAPAVVAATRYRALDVYSLNEITHTISNTNKAIENIPGLLASKTGFTDLAGGNLVFAFDAGPNHPIIVSILGSTREGRFRDAEKLVNASLVKLAQ